MLSWMSATFVVEAMSIANAVVKSSGSGAHSGDNVSSNRKSDYELSLRCEMGFMANLFFTALQRKLFYATLGK